MRKVFKFLTGTAGGGFSASTFNSGATSLYSSSGSSLPNFKWNSQQTLANSSNWRDALNLQIQKPTISPSFMSDQYKAKMTTPYLQLLTLTGIDLLGKSTEVEGKGQPAPTTKGAGAANVGNTLGTIADIGSMIVPKKPQSGLTSGLDTGYDAASSAIMTMGPYGMLIGGIMKAGGLAVDAMRALGVGTDLVTTEDQILDSKFLALTPIGLANAFGAKKGQLINRDLDYEKVKADMGAGYGSALAHLDTAEKYAGKKMGNVLGQRDRANKKVYTGNYDLARMLKIWEQGYINNAIQGTQSDMAFNKENLRMKGGWDDGAISFGRRGMIISPQRMRMIRHITQSYKPLVYTETELSEEEVMQFKNGGSFNLIPEGALHARLHHMENTDGFTKKGIPVVAEKDGGEVELQAEIELNEIIFRLEVTNEIEKLMNDDSDNAAIECGKMLVKEIFENTDDRTGLIEALEEPKEDQGSVVKEHRVFQEGGKMEEDIRQRLIKEWPALSNILFYLVPDSTFTSDKTGLGSIEYFAPDEEDEMSYPNGYKHKNPHKGEASIVYDPVSNDYEDIKMDLLHALRVQDPKYRALVEELDSVVLNGDDDLSYNARLRYNEDYKKLGKEYMPFKNYVSNEVDGLLRNLFYNASPEVLHKKRYYPNKEELRKWNEHLLPYIERIQKYLQGND